MNLKLLRLAVGFALTTGAFACDNEDVDPEAELEKEATLSVKSYVTAELENLLEASEALQAAAPEPDDDGWSLEADREAVLEMREHWADARDAYERVEGSIALLFTELDTSTDARYDALLNEDSPDEALFDGEGVTGMHAIERILYAGEHPDAVIAFESGQPGYQEAAFPATEAEAEAFKDELAKRLVDDCETMLTEFKPRALDAATAYNGVVGSMAEQLEKVLLAVSAEDESRYAKRTLDDMRANLEGGVAVYEAFQPWLLEVGDEELDAEIVAGFDEIDAAYEAIEGPAIPDPPEGFDARDPSEEDLETDYGELFKLLTDQTKLDMEGSLLNSLAEAADQLGIELE
jgi:iron uptake system component EfeO